MIVAYLQGQLGNTLFEIAASIGAGEFYGREFLIQGNWKYRKYFNIPDERYIDEYALPEYKEPHFHYALIPDMPCELFGYFQSIKYWKHCEDKIREYFSPSPLLKKQLEKRDMSELTSIHIRGGDYLKLKEYHYNLEPEYYKEAIRQSGDCNFVVFTDDKKHAHEVLPKDIRFLSSNETEIVDFFMMASCKNHIIANSSFSWWASYLNPNKDKKVFAPPQWFGSEKKHCILSDLYLSEWNIVNY